MVAVLSAIAFRSCGTPVIAYGKGGALETVRGLGVVDANPTGIFFAEQTAAAITAAVAEFEQNTPAFDPAAIRQHAEGFSIAHFRDAYRSFVLNKMAQWQAQLPLGAKR